MLRYGDVVTFEHVCAQRESNRVFSHVGEKKNLSRLCKVTYTVTHSTIQNDLAYQNEDALAGYETRDASFG